MSEAFSASALRAGNPVSRKDTSIHRAQHNSARQTIPRITMQRQQFPARLLPPTAFGMVSRHIYRSSYPTNRCLPFVQSLNLKTIIALQPKEVLPDLRNFCASNGIQLLELDVGENQEPFLTMDNALTAEAVAVATDESSQPCLLFCSTGKTRTTCVAACIRRCQGWGLASILDEYAKFMEGPDNVHDWQFIECFDPAAVKARKQHAAASPSTAQGSGSQPDSEETSKAA